MLQNLQNMQRIIFPVSSYMNITAGFQKFAQPGDQGRLDQAALVVLSLGPGIGKENVYAVQGIRGQHVVHYLTALC